MQALRNPNGNLKHTGVYKNGKSEGFWLFYYDNGKIKSYGNYSNNIKLGLWLNHRNFKSIETAVISIYRDIKLVKSFMSIEEAKEESGLLYIKGVPLIIHN